MLLRSVLDRRILQVTQKLTGQVVFHTLCGVAFTGHAPGALSDATYIPRRRRSLFKAMKNPGLFSSRCHISRARTLASGPKATIASTALLFNAFKRLDRRLPKRCTKSRERMRSLVTSARSYCGSLRGRCVPFDKRHHEDSRFELKTTNQRQSNFNNVAPSSKAVDLSVQRQQILDLNWSSL